MTTLGEVSTGGGTYGVGLSSRPWVEGDPRYIRITDVGDDGQLNSKAVAPDGDRSEWEKALLREGDLLFARSGATVGKTYLHRAQERPAVYAGYLIRFQLDTKKILPEYAFRYTQSSGYRSWVANAQRAVAQPNINAKQYASLPFPLPPLDEQRRIAAILDQADGLKEKQRAAQATLDGLVDSIFLEMFGDPASQSRFESSALGDLVDFYSGGTPSKSKDEYWHGQLPWFSPKDLKKPYLWDSVDHISDVVPIETTIRKLPADTVVLVVRGMILAHTVPVSLIRVPATVNQDLKALLPRSPVDPLFLQSALRVQHQRILGLVSTAAHGTKKLETQSLREVQIPRPGTVAEGEFSRRVQHAGRLSEELTQLAGDLDDLFTSLQSRAFSGRL